MSVVFVNKSPAREDSVGGARLDRSARAYVLTYAHPERGILIGDSIMADARFVGPVATWTRSLNGLNYVRFVLLYEPSPAGVPP